ncbi:DUF3600 domain-containing protein [Paenibacillus sp. 19GGS1-52]|uniref:DUF3600 domain-containing protein n=1 Tax=Paenibacillus sp. 19GGS1-52 TaxID=2758563 RepID=UPI001EFA5667|nr:DUF3600 domain-containing protein [Paenibacillus sp. 19GGS1-52]ULO06519.1 DUF3600 domain-containing protein [Paenibacillus sp. 19GGS1-52]
MNLEEELRTVLREETRNWIAPPELQGKILKQVLSTQGGRRMKKWLVASIVAVSLLIPTGAYAGYHYLADSIYGSQDNVTQIGATQQKYDELEAKLQKAKQSFSEQEFTQLMDLLKKLGSYNLKIADAEGGLHPEQLSADDQKSYKSLTAELEPYFAQLDVARATLGAVPTLTFDTLWNEQRKKAEQILSQPELAAVEAIINELKVYDAKTLDPDGSIHTDRLSEADLINQKQLIEQLSPYMKKLGIMFKPSS